METDTEGKRAFRKVNQSKFVFESWQQTTLVMERGRLRKKEGTERERETKRGWPKKKEEEK